MFIVEMNWQQPPEKVVNDNGKTKKGQVIYFEYGYANRFLLPAKFMVYIDDSDGTNDNDTGNHKFELPKK